MHAHHMHAHLLCFATRMGFLKRVWPPKSISPNRPLGPTPRGAQQEDLDDVVFKNKYAAEAVLKAAYTTTRTAPGCENPR